MGIKHLSPKTEEELRASSKNMTPYEMLKFACEEGLVWMAEEAIKKGADPAINNNHPLLWACQNGQYKIIQYLLTFPKVDPSDLESVSLRSAVYYRHIGIVKLLLKDGRHIEGNLIGYDEYMNLVLDEVEESKDENKRRLGRIILRGSNVVSISFI